MCTHFKPTDTFQYTHFDSCHPPGVSKGFIKGEALRLLRTNSSKAKFDEHIALFKQRLPLRGYPDNLLNMTLSEVKFSRRMSALQNKQKTRKRILSFVTEYYGGPWVSRHNQISHGTTKCLTAQPNVSRHNQKLSRHNQKSHGTTKNSHGTTKYLTAQPNSSRRK